MFTFLYTCFSLFWSTPTDIFWDPTFGFHLTACGPAFFVVFQDCGLPSVESADELLTEAELLRPPHPLVQNQDHVIHHRFHLEHGCVFLVLWSMPTRH